MAQIDKDQVRAEIERQIRNETTNASYLELGRIQGNNTLAEHLLAFLDTIPEQPERQPMNIPSAGGGMSTNPPKFKLDVKPEVDLEKEEYVGVAESPLKTFQRVNEFEDGANYRH